MKNEKDNFIIESCAPVAVVQDPTQIKEPENYNQVELIQGSRASGKSECDTIDENTSQKSHQYSSFEKTTTCDDVRKFISFLNPKNWTSNQQVSMKMLSVPKKNIESITDQLKKRKSVVNGRKNV